MILWLADTLAAAGLTVHEVDGWRERGKDGLAPKGVICHHTGGPANATGTPSLQTIIHGRVDLLGPLSQLYLARNGDVYVVAAGRSNHAGAGQWRGVTTGNSSFIGIEAENAGTGSDPWAAVQMDAYARTVAAILRHIGATADWCAGHKEYALPRGRKVDPTFDMTTFRANVARLLGTPNSGTAPVPSDHPRNVMLRLGDNNSSVGQLQGLLRIRADDRFGPATQAAVRVFQSNHELTPDGLVGPATWRALGV